MSWSTVLQGHPDLYPRTLAGPTPHLYTPTQSLGSLAHRREPHAGPGRRGIKPSPVVYDPGQHGLALRLQAHLDARRPGVAPGVGEGLLENAQQLHARLSGELLGEVLLDPQRHLALRR